MHVLFVVPSLRAGGAERVASLLSSYWAERGLTVTLVTFDVPEQDFYQISHQVHRVSLGIFYTQGSVWQKIRKNIERFSLLRQHIRSLRPDVVLSFMDVPNVISLVGALGTGIPVMVSERIDPSFYRYGRVLKFLKQSVYQLCAACVCQTEAVRAWANGILPAEKVWVIPNPVKSLATLHRSRDAEQPANKTILAMGRLDSQKGFDRLISAFAMARAQGFSDWNLVILGEGTERAALEQQLRALNLEGTVLMPGLSMEPESYFQTAALFVMSSRYEGFPNALLEAMAYGLPVISYDCKSGPADMIVHGQNGLLVPEGEAEIPALAAAMTSLMGNPSQRLALGQEAQKMKEAYSIDKIGDRWLALFASICHRPSDATQNDLEHLIRHELRQPNAYAPVAKGPWINGLMLLGLACLVPCYVLFRKARRGLKG